MAEGAAKDGERERESSSNATNGGDEPGGTPGPETARERLTTPPSDERTIHQRMVAILAELPALGKVSENKQQGFMYRSHDDVLNELNPLLAKHGVYLVPEVLERITDKRTTSRNAIMYEVNLLVRYTFVAADGSWIAASAWGEGTDMGDKSTNKAMTMAFKNVIAQAFAVSTQETQRYDADGESPEETVAPAAGRDGPASTAANRRREKIGKLADELDAKTKAEPGAWRALVAESVQRDFGVPITGLRPSELDEVGKVLVAQVGSEISEIPETLDLTVPF